MKSKTLIYSPSHGIWGGGQIYIEQLCNYLNDRKVESYILSSEPETFDAPTKKMANVLSKKERLLTSFSIARKYKREGFKTIILNDLSSLWLAPIFKLYGFNVVSLLLIYLQKRSENPLGHSFFEYYLLKASAYFCDAVFSVEKNNVSILGEKRVRFIGNFVPQWFFEAEAEEKQETKKYDFILIARLAEQKNIPLFLRILKKMNDTSGREFTALIVGEGPEKENILQLIAELELDSFIDIEGWVERKQLPFKYDLGKCFVISSLHEGFATTLIEAHARGLPSIVTRSSGFCGEFVEGYGSKTGIVFEPGDLERDTFYVELIGLVDTYRDYREPCLKKAECFSQESVLTPILKAVTGAKDDKQ